MTPLGTAAGPGRIADAEALLLRFEQAWRHGTPPRLETYVAPDSGTNDPGRRGLLLELVMLDLEYRWRNGSRPAGMIPRPESPPPIADCRCLEDYLRLYPELGPPELASEELLVAEYRVRHRWGDRPAHAEYLARFGQNRPLLADLLKRVDGELAVEFARTRRPGPLPSRPAGVPSPPPTPIPLTTAAFVELVQRYQMLSGPQMTELSDRLQRAHSQPRALARELLERCWLTAYQINQLFLGNGEGLLLGGYLLEERLGEGGTGQVFKARHLRMRRTVALKVIRRELLANEEVVRRFYREVQMLSRLTHPNIVHAYDAGPVGETHFLVMEYVRGIDLAKHVRQSGPLPAAQAIDYIRQAAHGLEHIHQAGLIHRDLKPHNLLLASGACERPGWPLVKLLDLGLARPAFASLGETTHGSAPRSFTPVGAVLLGTLDYMAPEQALDCHQADIRSDLYSLGCTLYFLLTGQPPFSGGTLAQRLLSHQQAPAPAIEALRRDLPPGLGEVFRKLLAKRPEDRFQKPAELAYALAPLVDRAEELQRKRSLPLAQWVEASPGAPPSPFALPVQLPRAGRRPVALLTAATILFAIGLSAYLLWPGTQSQPSIVPMQPAAKLARPPGVTIEPEQLAVAPAAPLGPGALVTRPAPVEGAINWTIETRLPRGAVKELAYSPDGKWLAVSSEDQVVRLYLAGTTHLVHALVGHDSGGQPNQPVLLAWSPDSRYLASGGVADGAVRLWEVETGRTLRTFRPSGLLAGVAWSPDGRTIACTARQTSAVMLFDPTSGRQLFSLEGQQGGLGGVAWSPDGKVLAAGGAARTIGLWDTASGRTLRTITGATGYVTCLAWTPDSTMLASTAQGDDQVRVWDTRTGKQLASAPNRNPGTTVHLGWSPGGKTLAIADGGVRLWEPGSARPPRSLPSGAQLGSVAWSPNGKVLATGGSGQGGGPSAVELWDIATSTLVQRIEGHILWTTGQGLVWSPDGRTLAAVNYPFAGVSLWDAVTGQWRRTLQGHSNHIMAAAWSPDGKSLATGSLDRDVRLWNPATGNLLARCPGHTAGVSALAWSPDGKALASGGSDAAVRLWDAVSGKNSHTLAGHQDAIGVLAWSPDCKRLASGGGERDRTVRLWDIATGQAVQQPLPHPHGLSALAWGPDGKILAAGMAVADSVFLWDPSKGEPVKELKGYQGGVRALDWLSNDILAATCTDRKVRQWEVSRGQPLRTAELPGNGTLAPDRKTMAGLVGPTLRFWETDTGRPCGTLLLLQRDLWLAIAPDGSYRAVPQLERELVIVVQTGTGQETLAPEEFQRQYRWRNDPKRVRFVPR